MNTKKQILALLERNRGYTVSGESIAAKLGISRNAVWKAVNELKKSGYNIQAITNKGYSLCEDNDILSVQGMLPFLNMQAIHPESIQVHAELESTNKTAKELAISGAEHGTVVIAEAQTAGKGRYGRGFHSPPNSGIYLSLVLRPEQLGFTTPTLITSFAAVAVCEAVETLTGKSPQIKWVNDVFLDRRKICGILTEAVTDFESGGVQWLVLGIGVNFKAGRDSFPEEVREIAGAVFDTDSEAVTITRNRLCAEIINYILASDCDEKSMLEKYKQRLFVLGETVKVISAEESYQVVAIDLDEVGRLVVRKPNGEIVSLSSGEISIKI